MERKGICKNVGVCTMAGKVQVITDDDAEMVCPECGEPLEPCKEEPLPEGPNPKKKLIALIVAALLLVGLGVGAYFLFAGSDKPTKITLDKGQITMKVGESIVITPKVEPEGIKATFIFKTRKGGEIVTVSQDGKIAAMKSGKTQVLVKCEENSELKAICKIEVLDNKDSIPRKPDTTVVTPPTNEAPKVEPKKTETKPVKTTPTEILNGLGTKVLSYGKYSGNLKNGQPDGTGKLTFTRAYQLNADYTAQPGEYITGVFENGKPSFVTYYQKDGTVVKIKLR